MMIMLEGLVSPASFHQKSSSCFQSGGPTVKQYLIRHNLPDGMRANQIKSNQIMQINAVVKQSEVLAWGDEAGRADHSRSTWGGRGGKTASHALCGRNEMCTADVTITAWADLQMPANQSCHPLSFLVLLIQPEGREEVTEMQQPVAMRRSHCHQTLHHETRKTVLCFCFPSLLFQSLPSFHKRRATTC